MGPARAHMGPYGPARNRFIKRVVLALAWPGPGWGPVRVGARSELGPIWALMGPPGQVLEFRKLSVETFGPISHVSDSKLVF